MATATVQPEAQRRGYEGDQLGWPATVEEGPAVIAGEAVDTITMPPAFGALVQAELQIMMLAGPVVSGPAEESWAFLTQPANTRSPAVPRDLLALGVRLVPAGSRVVLPEASGRSGRWTWVTPPTPGREPAIWSAVIGAARRVAARLLAEQGRRSA